MRSRLVVAMLKSIVAELCARGGFLDPSDLHACSRAFPKPNARAPNVEHFLLEFKRSKLDKALTIRFAVGASRRRTGPIGAVLSKTARFMKIREGAESKDQMKERL